MTVVHIDGHDSGNVVWNGGITTIPLRRRDGALLQMTPVVGDRIAESITWTDQAMTNFGADSTLQDELKTLMGKHERGEFKKLNLIKELGLSSC